MDAAKLQAKVYAGYAKASKRIGFTADHYRATSASSPLDPGNHLDSFPVSFNAEDMRYGKPNKYGHPTWYGLFNGSTVAVGDYLTNAQDGTYFVAALQTILPPLLVQCNRIISIVRPQLQSGVGLGAYGGNTAATETPLMTAWPASVLHAGRGGVSEVGLPGDTANALWQVLVPAFPGVILRSGDVVTDELARRYVISAAELTDLGWRISAYQAQT